MVLDSKFIQVSADTQKKLKGLGASKNNVSYDFIINRLIEENDELKIKNEHVESKNDELQAVLITYLKNGNGDKNG